MTSWFAGETRNTQAERELDGREPHETAATTGSEWNRRDPGDCGNAAAPDLFMPEKIFRHGAREPAVSAGLCTEDIVPAKIVRLSTLAD